MVMNSLYKAISDGHCLLNLRVRTLDDAIEAAIQHLVQKGKLPAEEMRSATDGLKEREKEIPSSIGHACAIPHYYSDSISEPALVFIRLNHPLNVGALDGVALRFIFVLIGPISATRAHLDSLASIARLMSDDEAHYEMGTARTDEQILQALERFAKRQVPPPAKEPVSGQSHAGLEGSWTPGAGIVDDLKRRIPSYVSDFVDGLNTKTIASVLFLFFACLAPAITFGGLLSDQTGQQIGAVEMLVATAICGSIYALVAGQPLIILGGIGPLFVFTIILYRLCDQYAIQDHFLAVYGWVGLWTALFTVLLAVTNASNLMKYFTRFTDEIFSALMSLIFIYEAVRAIYNHFAESFATPNSSHDEAFLSFILAMGTMYIGLTLSRFRKSHFLIPWMREFLADFGPSIALAAMAIVGFLLSDKVPLESLTVNNGFGTTSGRPWMVDLFAAPRWTWFAAAGPAILATVLIFLSQNITARLVNSPDNKIRKGPSYHWDLLMVGVLVGFCSLFGFPWLVAATVRSLAHVRALADIEEVADPEGGSQDRITHTVENRVSGLLIHLLIGLTLFALPLLAYVPKATLYGVFLFMGVVSLGGNQFIERLSLWLRDSNMYPSTHYIRRVPVQVVHLFTLVQFVCLIILCYLNVVDNEKVRILFPVFIALLVPLRFCLDYFFSQQHLEYLDADEDPEEEGVHWV